MTTVAAPARPTTVPVNRGHAVGDAITMAWRNLLNLRRTPELVVFATIQPIIFILLFAYVFGSAITVPGGGNYRAFLMPGIFAQTMAFACGITAVGVADDMTKGIIDRFRSLPMARFMCAATTARSRVGTRRRSGRRPDASPLPA